MNKVAVVTGGSSGIGRQTAKLLAEKGYTVFEFSRSGKAEGAVRHITADVTDESQVKAAFEQVFSETGRLDLLVNNAGMGISGAVEFTELHEAKRIFDVNFFGVFLCVKESIKYLRETRNSQIINVSSVAAEFSIPYQSFYSATKSAQNSLTLALSGELCPFGIRVNALMPGDVSTGFTAARSKSEAGTEVYGNAINSAVGVMEKDELGGMRPEKIAKAIFKVSQKKCTGRIFTVGGKYKVFVFISRFLPVGFVTKTVASMYR
ncbi:MAG: SDR family NAD(P)-dependent oxidoreductase [Clostridiales bacterium]|nr:SDR family NAD(P)-dependent oxidoreductase [Clostridiales bacterium]